MTLREAAFDMALVLATAHDAELDGGDPKAIEIAEDLALSRLVAESGYSLHTIEEEMYVMLSQASMERGVVEVKEVVRDRTSQRPPR